MGGTMKAYRNSGEGIQWTITSKLEDLAFADDLALLSHRLQNMRRKWTILKPQQKKVSLKISHAKTMLPCISKQQKSPVTVFEKVVTDVDDFVYLESEIGHTGGTDEDIKTRVKKARQAFVML